MAQFTCIFLIAAFALMQINALPLVVDEEGNGYYLVPVEPEAQHSRARRATGWDGKTSYDISRGHVGLGQQVSYDTDNHRFAVSASGGRDFRPKGPLTTSQGFEYSHKPSGSSFDINASNTRGQGTDLSASGTYNFFQTPDKKGTIGLSGDYNRHYGGPWGTQKPSYGVFLRGKYDF